MALNDDGGCEVDWSWLEGQRVTSVKNSLDALIITFESGLEWKVEARLWQGAPFLAFQPWEKP
jgi:hypothetical protein